MHDDSVTALATYIAANAFDLVIIDTLSKSINGADENSSAEMGAYIGNLSKLKEAREGTTILAIAHSRKDDPTVLRGSGALFAGVDRILNWTAKSDERLLTTQKDKSGAPQKPIRAEFLQLASSAVLIERDPEGSGDDSVVLRALKNLLATGNTTVMRSDFQHLLVDEGLWKNVNGARAAVRRAIERGDIHDAGGVLRLGPGDYRNHPVGAHFEESGCAPFVVLQKVAKRLRHHYAIGHPTLFRGPCTDLPTAVLALVCRDGDTWD